MTVLTEGTHAGEYRIRMAAGDRSTESCTFASGQTPVAGSIVVATDLSAVTVAGVGDTTDLAIAYDAVDASSAAAPGVVDVRDCTVNGNDLVFANGISTVQRDAQVAALAASGVIVRF